MSLRSLSALPLPLPLPLLLASALVVSAQQVRPTVEIRDLQAVPRDVADEVQQVFNAETSRRVTGDFIVASSDSLGDVAVLNGHVVVSGRVTGKIVVINGSLIVRGEGRVGGTAIAIGGTVTAMGRGQLEGTARSYPGHVLVETSENLLVIRDETDDERWYRQRTTPQEKNRSDLRLITAKTYNRIEGLPLLLGPRAYMNFSWGRLTADVMGVFRSADQFEFNSETLGHQIRAEFQLGGSRGIRIAGRLDDVVAPVEEWHLSDAEVGIATFLLHRDFRDYYNRHGGTVSATGFVGNHLDATVSWTDEQWATPGTRDPFSLFRNGQDWRVNPLLDAGRFHLVRVGARYDTRNDNLDPWSGWFVTADYEYGVGKITDYGPTSPGIRDINPTGRNNYDRLLFDVRRYNRLSAEGQLNLRLLVGGWLSGDDLPLQRRFALGSAGSLPGYDFRQILPGTDVLTCAGAPLQGTAPSPPGVPAQCERFALGQVEYRGEVGNSLFGLLDQERRRRRLGWGRRAEWVVFADVGRGWLVGPRAGELQYGPGQFPSLFTFRADAGIGLRLDDIGLYIAKSVTDPHTPLNFFARLQPRF